MKVTHKPTARALLVALLASTIAIVALAATPATAQEDPYGGTTTTEGVSILPTCHLGLTSGKAGATGVVTVHKVPFGATVRVLLGGTEVGRATAPLAAQSAGTVSVFGGAAAPAQAATTTLNVPFTVPKLSAGVYLITAVGADFTLSCDNGANFEVLADSVIGGGGDSGGFLPRTGIYALLLVLVALLLILLGRVILAESRRRRRRDERAPHITGPSGYEHTSHRSR